ncbi:MAG: hypothetical protein M3512_01985 [Bacteroidota bacterium]|nr:hypothetical protein [Bacteroidota bacterium]
MDNKIPAETRFDDMTGAISMNFAEGNDFNRFAEEVAGVNLQQYQPISLRIYIQSEVIITIYAVDKMQYESHKSKTGKLLVRKYKLDISLQELFSWFRQIDFTLISGNYNIEDFEVIN